jgi:RNA polymerase sigma factor (sigma-70 family)
VAGAPTSETGLAAAAMAGEAGAFGELVKLHQAGVRALCRRLARGSGEADDIAQAAFLTAWRRISTWRGGSFRSWVCAIAYREFLHRRRGNSEAAEEFELAVEETPGERIDVTRAMAALEPNERSAIALCLGAGLSHSEAAEVMSAPLGSVKSWVLRGRAKLQTALAAYQKT